MDAAITTFMICYEMNSTRQHWYNAVKLISYYRRCEDVVNLTSWFKRCNNIVNTTFIAQCKLNLLSKVEPTLEQRCNFDVGVSTSLQRCVLVVRHCDLTTTLCVCWNRTCLTGFWLQNSSAYGFNRNALKYIYIKCSYKQH